MATRQIAIPSLCTALLFFGNPGRVSGQIPEPAVLSVPQATAPLTASFSTARAEMPGFSDLIKPLGGDFKRLLSGDNIYIAGIGAVGSLTAYAWDRNVAAADWGRGDVRQALEPGHIVGSPLFQAGAALTTYSVGRATNSPRLATIGADLVRAQIVAQTVTGIIKVGTQRARPDGTTLSFPSGHTSSAFATASVLHSHRGWKAGAPAYAVATWVAASRVQQDRHFLSDVIAGATVGLLAGRSVTVGRGSARFSVAPMAVPGGAGVSFVKVGR